MLQSMESQRVGHDWVTEQQQQYMDINTCTRYIVNSKCDQQSLTRRQCGVIESNGMGWVLESHRDPNLNLTFI